MKNLSSRYSIRKYKDKPVEKELVDDILEAMLLSPSGKNKRPWEFLSIDDPSLIKSLAKSKKGGAHFLSQTPHVIMVLSLEEESDTWIEDASITLTIGHLKAHDLGLGSCWIQIRNRVNDQGPSENYVRELLDLPKHIRVVGLLSIGYADEEVNRPKKVDFDKVHYNTYGGSNE